jgi:transposase
MFLPPYSSELNPIESFWSLLKHKWQKNLLLYGEDLQGIKRKRPEEQRTKMTVLRLKETIGKEEISLEVTYLIGSIFNDTIKQLARAHFRALVNVLRGELV